MKRVDTIFFDASDCDRSYLIRVLKEDPSDALFFGKIGTFHCFSRNYFFTIDDISDKNDTGYYLKAINVNSGNTLLENVRGEYQVALKTIESDLNDKDKQKFDHISDDRLVSQDVITDMILDNDKIILDVRRYHAKEIVVN